MFFKWRHNNTQGIEPHRELFYIEAMLATAHNAMRAQTNFQVIYNDIDRERHLTEGNMLLGLDVLQVFLTNAALLSSYFWPISKASIHQRRGKHLCQMFGMTDNSPLKTDDVRAFLKPLDERIDLFLKTAVSKPVTSAMIFLTPNIARDNHLFRAVDLENLTYYMLEQKIAVGPLIEEVIRVFELLEKFHQQRKHRYVESI